METRVTVEHANFTCSKNGEKFDTFYSAKGRCKYVYGLVEAELEWVYDSNHDGLTVHKATIFPDDVDQEQRRQLALYIKETVRSKIRQSLLKDMLTEARRVS